MYYRERNGKWYFTVYVRMPDGKAKRVEHAGGRSRLEAQIACSRFLQKHGLVDDGPSPHTKDLSRLEDITTGEFLKIWIGEYKKLISYNTFRSYRNIIETHVLPALGTIRLKNLTNQVLQEFFITKAEQVSYNTLMLIASVLSRAFTRAIDIYKFISINPMRGVTLPKSALYKEANYFSPEDIQRIFQYYTSQRLLYIPIMLAYYTGMRRGEILALSWDAIDFDERLIHVFQTLHVEDNVVSVRDGTKTRRERWIGMNQHLKEILLEHQKWQNNQREKYGRRYKRSNFVCTHPNGTVITPNNIRWFNQWCRKEGIKGTFHSFRHTFATRMLELGLDIGTISKLLGHSTVKLTIDTYLHLTKVRQKQCLELIDKL